MKFLSSNLSLALCLIITTTSAFAQTEQEFEVQEDALNIIKDAEQARRAESGLDRYSHIKGGPVGFAEIAKDPDNVQLNFRYAKTQVADGNLRGAGASLERILIIDPSLVRVRLFYTQVLYRLDNLQEARAQLAILSEQSLNARDQNELAKLQSRIDHRARTTNYTASIGAGVTYQSNANYAPGDEKVDVILNALGTTIFIPDVPTDKEEDDLGFLGTASLGFEHDLGYQEGHSLFGGARAYWNEQITVDSSDYNTYFGNVGGLYKAPWGDLKGQLIAGHFALQRDTFLNYYGFDINLERQYYDGKLTSNLRHRTTYEDYDLAAGTTTERTGYRHEFEIAGNYRWVRNQIIGISLQFLTKSAEVDWQEYDGIGFELSHTYLHKRGITIRNKFAYAHEEYDAFNPRVSFTTRDDDDLYYQLSASSLLGRLFRSQQLPGWLADIRANASFKYTKEYSNIQNFEYDNARFDLFFTRNFNF